VDIPVNFEGIKKEKEKMLPTNSGVLYSPS